MYASATTQQTLKPTQYRGRATPPQASHAHPRPPSSRGEHHHQQHHYHHADSHSHSSPSVLPPARMSSSSSSVSTVSNLPSSRSNSLRRTPGLQREWRVDDLYRSHWNKPSSYREDHNAHAAVEALNLCRGFGLKKGTLMALRKWELVLWQERVLFAEPSGLSYQHVGDDSSRTHIPFDKVTAIEEHEGLLRIKCLRRSYQFHLRPAPNDERNVQGRELSPAAWARALRQLARLATGLNFEPYSLSASPSSSLLASSTGSAASSGSSLLAAASSG